MSFLSLPNELLLTVADNLEPRDINLLIQTNRHLGNILTPYIRRLAGRPPYELGALFWAASSGNTELTKLLLSVARNITVKQVVDETIIFYPEPGQPSSPLRFVLEKDQLLFYDLEVEGKSFHWAVRNSHYALARLMLDECGIEVDKDIIYDPTTDPLPGTPLPYACANGDLKMVQILLSKGACVTAEDPHRNNRTPLHVAAAEGQLDIVRLLLENGANPASRDTNSISAIEYAGCRGHHDIARLLLENVDSGYRDHHQRPLITVAILYSHHELVRKLIQEGRSIDQVDNTQMTTLHHAAKNGNEAVVKLLLDNGAEINAPDRLRRTPLHLAVQYGDAAVQELIARGADVNVRDRYKRTPLHLAAKSGLRVVETLLGVGDGVDLNAVDKFGRTPLHLAAQFSGSCVFNILVGRGADVEVKDLTGRTPMYWVEKRVGWGS